KRIVLPQTYVGSPRTPDQINDIISAELPCPTNDPDAYKLVLEFMLHGPCGVEVKHAPCTNEGKCSKRYPKKFLAETVISEDGYPVYCRRDNKITAVKGRFTYDNRHVVPHNRGAQSFTDLKMVNKINYATFKAACFAGKEEKINEDDVTTGDGIEKTSGSDPKMPVKETEKDNKEENGTKNKQIKRAEKEEAAEAPNSQHVGYYLKHRINEKLIDRLVDNHRFNGSLSGVRVGKMKGKTYNLLHRGLVYKAILKKKKTRREDIGGNFEIPCKIGGLKRMNAL
nr:helicase [Tanacetum cinerariifolium]